MLFDQVDMFRHHQGKKVFGILVDFCIIDQHFVHVRVEIVTD